ncbi:MAG: pyruvate dehydrogenase (acetyl-transferring), homodimeric type [bacterium]
MDQEPQPEADQAVTEAWIASLREVIASEGKERARHLLSRLIEDAQRHGVITPFTANTPYVNTISLADEPLYPGDRDVERRIRNIIRWNSMAMVVRANRRAAGIGGHIATYQSLATLLEVGFHHFFHAHTNAAMGDFVYLQGHSAPGVYARAFLEGRLSQAQLTNFRRELADGGGLSSYPHPWLMPDFWEFPTVSMGLSAISSIYQARYMRYLQARDLAETSGARIWAFLGDGEMDEPESMGAITLAARERLDNLTWVVNCNLQRLDGPVRGNGKIIQELEAAFRGAGWNVIKVIWGEDWDPLLARDKTGLLARRMGEVVDGQYQKYTVESGAYIRDHFFGRYPQLLELVSSLTDQKLNRMRRGGHDPAKVYAAYRAADAYRGAPTVILAKTVKGYGLGTAAEGKNISHGAKKLNPRELREFRDRLGIPIGDAQLEEVPFWRPAEAALEIEYLRERRAALGGPVPQRRIRSAPLAPLDQAIFEDFRSGSRERDVATTQVFVSVLRRLMSDPDIGRLIVPIVPDEARTFGMDSLFRKFGIFSQQGQRYDPVDSDVVAFYREAEDGQLLEEGITEAGAMASFTAAGTGYAAAGVNTIPFYLFYSMFGFQRIGDSIWQHADARGKGFLIGCTAGRTTLAGEGLQHQDGQSHILASAVPTLRAYDPAYAYELAVIVEDGIRRMYVEREDLFYYLTVTNDAYVQHAMPEGVEAGILRGLYRLRSAEAAEGTPRVHLFGSGALLPGVLRAQELLAARGMGAEVWSVTSWTELQRNIQETDRWNRLHPTETSRRSFLQESLADQSWPIIGVSDYLKSLPASLAGHAPEGIEVLGTDGFGRSETRDELRRFFEVDAEHITVAALSVLARRGAIAPKLVAEAITEFGIDADTPDPRRR